jgi:flavodoxin
MINRKPRPQFRSHFEDNGMNFIFKLFPFFFMLVMFIVFGTMAISGYLGYQCYSSNNPNSIACYMMSDRQEIGIRVR